MTDEHEDLEGVERAALEDLHAAASPADREALDLRLETVADALVSMAGQVPSLLVNRTLGLGCGQPATREAIDAIAAAYRRHDVRRYLVHGHPQAKPAELADWLGEAGFRPYRRWMKFVRKADTPPEAGSTLKVERIGGEHGEDFARVAGSGFDLTEACIPWLAKLPDRKPWHVYMSFDESGAPAGTGAMFVRDGVAYFEFAATRPEARGRGSQRALLSRRLQDALALGCHTMVSMTGEAVAGDPQHSYRNLMWAGFREAYLRDNHLCEERDGPDPARR
jgi:GNAT superfamily N-acetyltransferase